MDNPIGIHVACTVKVNLGDYESAELSVRLSNIPYGVKAETVEHAQMIAHESLAKVMDEAFGAAVKKKNAAKQKELWGEVE